MRISDWSSDVCSSDLIDGHSHYVDIGTSTEPTPVGAMVSLTPRQAEPRAVDRTVIQIAQAHAGRYGLGIHLNHDPHASETFVATHVRRQVGRATGRERVREYVSISGGADA